MDNEPEVIRQQMDETRASLTEKIELLERQVVETVQGATSAVSETVDTVKQAVQETVDSVKETVAGAAETVKETFDLRRQVERRPWSMMAGATALGFLGGYLLGGNREREERRSTASADAWARTGQMGAYTRERLAGNGHEERFTAAPAPQPEAQSPGLMDSLGQTFHNEIQQVKGLALGALFGAVRDLLTRAVPPSLEGQVREVLNNLTTKLGGQPVSGPVLSEETSATKSTEPCAARQPAGNGTGI